MEAIKRTLQTTEFESSSTKTPQFKAFASQFKREFKKAFAGIATDIKFSVGHFYISGFFTVSGKYFYFSLSDVRGMNYNPNPQLLIRTAQSYKDYTGGVNQYFDMTDHIADDFIRRFNV